MRNLVVVASTHDPLANELCKLSRGYVRCTTSALLSRSEFGLHMNGATASVELALGRTQVSIDDVSGILFRPIANWRSSVFSSPKVRAFVRHESQAAWCALMKAIGCPVWNRLDPAWWVEPASYSATLAATLANELAIDIAPRVGGPSVYLVGRETLSDTSAGQRLADFLRENALAVNRWQRAQGVHFARIEFAGGRGRALARVDPVPSMTACSRAMLASVAARVIRALQ